MKALAGGVLVFVAAVVVQAIVWRWRRPRGEYGWLVALYVAVLAAAAVAAYATGIFGGGLLPYANFTVLYLSLVAAYAVSYSAIQADSPTMTMLLEIDAAGRAGIEKRELLARLTDDALVAPRLDDLIGGDLAAVHAGRYVIRPRGAGIARTYIAFRKLMRMEKGG